MNVASSAWHCTRCAQRPDASRDSVGQGAANVASGLLQGMPVGGSLSASALNKAGGARSRQAALIAGLLILIGVRTIKPADPQSVWRTGTIQKAVLLVTFVLPMLIPLQYALLVGVWLSVVRYVVRQSNVVTVRRWSYETSAIHAGKT